MGLAAVDRADFADQRLWQGPARALPNIACDLRPDSMCSHLGRRANRQSARGAGASQRLSQHGRTAAGGAVCGARWCGRKPRCCPVVMEGKSASPDGFVVRALRGGYIRGLLERRFDAPARARSGSAETGVARQLPLCDHHGMSKQIAARLPDGRVEFVDEIVACGAERSRAAVLTRS